MIQILLICLAISQAFQVDDYKQCVCNEILAEADCNANIVCQWNGAQKSCLKKDCSALKDQCNKIKGCALLADGKCAEFTKCSDYTVSNIGQCQYKDSTCTENVQTGAIWSCKTGTYQRQCQKITTKGECNGEESSTNVCFWTTNPTTKKEECMSVKFTNCTEGSSDPNLCTSNPSCKYVAGTKCTAKTCTDVTTEFFCTNIPQWGSSKRTLCEWNNGCKEATDVNTLGQAKCYKSTGGTYTWNPTPKQCIPCTGIDGDDLPKPIPPPATNTTTPTGSTGVSANGTASTNTTSTPSCTFLIQIRCTRIMDCQFSNYIDLMINRDKLQQQQQIQMMKWELMPSDNNEYSPRTGHTVIAHQNSIYVFGGIDEQDRQNDIYQFQNNWQKLNVIGEPPSPRSGSLAVVWEDQFYFFGGYTWKHGDYFNDLYRFNPESKQWQQLTVSSPPSPRVDHSFTIVKNIAYVFGGSNGQKRFSDLYGLDLQKLEWHQLPIQNVSNRFGHSIVSYKESLVLFGGWDGNNTLNDLWMINNNGVATYISQNNSPAGRYRHSAAIYKDTMVIFGGVDQNQERFNDLQQYSFIENSWQRIVVQNPPSPRSFHKCVVLNNYIYLIGGFDGQRRNDVHRIKLDFESEVQQKELQSTQLIKWIPLSTYDVFTPRTGHTVCVHQNRIYLFGGIDLDGNNNDLYVFEQMQWQRLNPSGTPPTARSGSKMIAYDDYILIFGGYIKNDQQHCNDLFRYSIKLNKYTQEVSETAPSRRTDHSLVEYRGILYVFGGKGENKQILNDIWRYRKEWKNLPLEQHINGRFGHTAVQHHNSMFIFGGWDGTNCLDDLFEFSFVTNMIYEIRRTSGCKPKARYRHEALIYNDDMFIFGGIDHLQTRYNDLFQYNFKKREWLRIITTGSVPSARTFHKFVNIENQLFVIGGFDGQRLNDMHSIIVKSTIKHKFSFPQEDSQVVDGEEVSTLKEQVKELSRKIQKEEEKHLCKICFSRQIDSVLMECGHFILCFNCTYILKNCPICRQVIAKVIRTSMF